MVHLPIIPTFFNKSVDQKKIDFDWTKTEIFLKIVLAMDVFIGFNVEPNMYKRNENAIHLGVLVHICPLPAPFKDKTKHRRNKKKGDKHEELRMKIQSEMVKVVLKDILEDNNCSNVENSELQIAADLITNMTLFIDDLNENYTLLQESGYLVDEKFSFKEFETLMENNMEIPLEVNFWVNYITNIFRWHSNVTIDAQTDYLYIRETESEYLWQILNYIQQQPPIYIELYMWWSAVYAIISNTSWTITDILLKVALSYYESDPDIFVKSRSLDCCELVNQYMAWPVSYAIADKTFPNKTKPKVEKIIEEIKEVFVEYVKNLKWMDDITKQATLEKSKEMLSFVGYPDWLFKDGALDRKHSGLEINETTYLKNMVNIIMQYTEETLTSLRLENPRDWTTEPIIVNAFNSFSDNAINVPMAILNYPLYDLGLDVLNYGSIGTILGHELMHGFDNSGRKYDKFGNYIQFWSNQTINAFENMTECFIKQYDNYTIDGVNTHVKGKVTLSENLADNGGLNQAYTAYKKHISRYGDDLKLPGFEHYSSFQMFFIAYGSVYLVREFICKRTDQST
ncbi:hypothetical protein ABEB36_004982 [Hypothenemus hampei]|uniref:Uncharacterized protein n=1 Tax=Hypothenemus hampei TaxID=57062 RepID=A0ABD1F0F3_HYPHA